MFICASPKIILNKSQGYMHLTLECDGEGKTVVWPSLDLGSDPPSTPSAPCVIACKLTGLVSSLPEGMRMPLPTSQHSKDIYDII